MAQKPQRRIPTVPRSQLRSTPGLSPISPPSSQSSSEVISSTVRKVVQPQVDLSVEYAHVKKDLIRIALFSTLIFAIMLALKFAGF